MSVKFVVGCDGSEASQRALDLAADLAGASNASLILAHVLEWSPYSFLTPTEIEERHKRRAEELERAEQALLKPLADSLKDRKIEVKTVIKYGHVAQTLEEIASSEKAAQMFIGRTGESPLSVRVFGSVAGTLAQITTVPCTIVP